MPGRHAQPRGRWRLPLAACLAGSALLAAVAGAPAGANAADPVVVTMGVTGATSSNCGALSLGGSDVWVNPGDTLAFKTTVAGVNLLGLKLGLVNISAVANLGGLLTIDQSTRYRIDASKTTTVTPLSTGNHGFTFAFDEVTLLSLVRLPLSRLLPAGPLNAGVTLNYSGTIHVTADPTQCGVAVQLPGPGVSVSATPLPPIDVSVSPIPVTVVPSIKTLLPSTRPASTPGTSSTAPSGPPPSSTSSGSSGTPSPTETILEGITGGSGGGGFPGTQPYDTVLEPTGVGLNGVLVGAAPVDPTRPGRYEQPDALPDFESGLNQAPVLLGILAILALASVTSGYARLHLVRAGAARPV